MVMCKINPCFEGRTCCKENKASFSNGKIPNFIKFMNFNYLLVIIVKFLTSIQVSKW